MKSNLDVGRAFSARSLALSLLLGTHPPVLPISSLVAAGELFGINGGAMRTALSRMVSAGEASVDHGSYRLSGPMNARQAVQDSGRLPVESEWDGGWITVTPRYGARPLSQRRELRRQLVSLRLGELRPGYWLRPDNINIEPIHRVCHDLELISVGGPLAGVVGTELADEIWRLGQLNKQADELLRTLAALTADLETTKTDVSGAAQTVSETGWLAPAFIGAAEVVRFLTREPRLPAELLPTWWAPNQLRMEYDRFETLFQHQMALFFRRRAQG